MCFIQIKGNPNRLHFSLIGIKSSIIVALKWFFIVYDNDHLDTKNININKKVSFSFIRFAGVGDGWELLKSVGTH